MICKNCGQKIPEHILKAKEAKRIANWRASVERRRLMGKLGRPRKKPWKEDEVLLLREQGYSLRDIAHKVSHCLGTVQKILKKHPDLVMPDKKRRKRNFQYNDTDGYRPWLRSKDAKNK